MEAHRGKRVVRSKQVAEYLNQSEPTVKTWAARGIIPHIRIAKKVVLYDLDVIDAWLVAHGTQGKAA